MMIIAILSSVDHSISNYYDKSRVVSRIKNGNELVRGEKLALKSDEFKSAIYVCQTWQLMSVKFRGRKSRCSLFFVIAAAKLDYENL